MFPFFFYFDSYYLILVVPALIISIWAQSRVKGTYRRYSQVYNHRGVSGALAARQILDDNGLYDVRVERAPQGELTDHYDPRANVVYLSQGVYDSISVAAVGIAAHEVGHAIQYAESYAPVKARAAILPATNIGSTLSVPLILIGLLAGSSLFINLGLILFSLVAVFQMVTLPVEYNASSRAMQSISSHMMLYDDEMAGAKKVLSAAALTYVAALLLSLAQMLRLVMLTGRRRS